MKIFALLLFSVVVGCAQAPKTEKSEWIIKPANPDKDLSEDEQFLKKSQQSSQETAENKHSRRTFLNP